VKAVRSAWRWLLAILIGGWLPVLLVAWWWNASETSEDPFFPPLELIWEQFKVNWVFANVPIHLVPSLQNLFTGFAIAIVVGIGLGVLIGASPTASRYVEPVIDFFRAIPGVALVPVFILLLGLDSAMRTASIAFAATMPILIATIEGVRTTNTVLLDTASVFSLTRSQVLFRVRLPNAMPIVFAGLQVAFQIAFIVTVASEYLGSGFGLGAFTLIATDSFMILDAWTGVLLLGLLGYALSLLFDLVERLSLRWYYGQKKLA
jgi:ABC-type nitrate/sulfonate/bicarbonate transport system permease component